MSTFTLLSVPSPRRWVAALSLAVPLWANAAAAPVVDVATVVTPGELMGMAFNPENWSFSAVEFFGLGVVRASGTLEAPAAAQWVPGVEGLGGFEISWGQDSGVRINNEWTVVATDFLLSLSANRVYADLEVRDIEGGTHHLNDLPLFYLEDVQVVANDGPDGPSLLGLSADVYIHYEGAFEMLAAMGSDFTPPNQPLPPVLYAHLAVGAVPEPATSATLLLGLTGVVGIARSRQSRVS